MPFFDDYQLYCSGNETPRIYNEWCALSALSAIVQRKVWIPFGFYDIHPNLYTVLVGPPAAHKTTAMATAKRLIRTIPSVKMAPTSTTREALIREMADNQKCFKVDEGTTSERIINYAPLFVCVSELSEFLTISKENMIGFLTAIWDEPFFEYKVKNADEKKGERKEDIIHGPILTLLAGTTPSWITLYLKSDVISGGFSRRAMFVYSDGPSHRIPIPEINPEQIAAWNRVVGVGAATAKLKGKMEWGDGTVAWWKKWYMTREIPKDPVVAGYHGSKPDLVLKIAMLTAMAERSELILRVPDLERALDLLDTTEKDLAKVLGGVGRNELAGALPIFWSCINAHGGEVNEEVLRRETYSSVQDKEYIEVCNHMLKTKAWHQITKNGLPYYVTPEKYNSYREALKKQPAPPAPTSAPRHPGTPSDAVPLTGSL